MAGTFILISALMMPVYAIAHASYFTLRSGGSTVVTFLYDSLFTWGLLIPLTWALVHWTQMPIVPLYLLTQSTNFVKFFVGILLVRSGVWQKNIVAPGALEAAGGA